VEIGRTWIARALHGTGVNAEAKYLMLRHAFEGVSPAALRVQLTANAANAHSIRAIEKLGAVREGTLRKARVLPKGLSRGEPLVRDWICFSILDEEWPAVRARLEARIRG
jgi:ribosomal-protein-alanine N-acetyltransferase